MSSKTKTNGRKIYGLPISVDNWSLPKYGDECRKYIYFLSHMHTDHTVGLTSTWPETIYTSKMNVELARHMLQVPLSKLVGLEMNEPFIISFPGKENENIGKTFQVTLLEANHIAGAVMFLFQGLFGNILYTGDFRYSRDMLTNPPLKELILLKQIDKLYVDNTYNDASHDFPPREDAIQQTIQIVKKFPNHRIIFGCHKIGKEDVLTRVATELQERVFVPEWIYDIYRLLPLPDVLITSPKASRLWFEQVHRLAAHKHLLNSSATIIIVLSALPLTGRLKSLTKKRNVFCVPYSNHCSYPELQEFISKIQAKEVYYTVHPKGMSSNHKGPSVTKKEEGGVGEKRPMFACPQLPAAKRRRGLLTEANKNSNVSQTESSYAEEFQLSPIDEMLDKLKNYLVIRENSVRNPQFIRMLHSLLEELEPVTGVKCPAVHLNQA